MDRPTKIYMKIVINVCYGGFGLSDAANSLLKSRGVDIDNLDRDSPELVAVVEKLKGRANDRFSKLKVIEIPDDTQWEIGDYDGVEYIYDKRFFWK